MTSTRHTAILGAPRCWDDYGGHEAGEGVDALLDWDTTSQSPPDYTDDQRITW